MHVEIFHDISGIHFPFDKNKAFQNLLGKEFYMVMTDRLTAQAHYCDPRKTNWEEAVIASCSLPFVTKANQMVDGRAYMDGAWGDPLPVEWAYRQGAKNITVIRTTPAEEKATKTWFDRLGEYYYLRNPKLRERSQLVVVRAQHPQQQGGKRHQRRDEHPPVYRIKALILRETPERRSERGHQHALHGKPAHPRPCHLFCAD